MAEETHCPECGAELAPRAALEGFCPSCLMKLGIPGLAEPPRAADPSADLDTTRSEISPSTPTERIGNYRLLQKLGEGGMGEVWQAEQLEPVRRTVALKLIKAGMDTRQVVARFESERQALALMSHPNIACVFDAGATDQGRPYFVMEHVPGVPITQYCDEKRLSTKERLRLFMQVCDGVQHAHQKGIIHRDIKPSNVLVDLQDGGPLPKIIDFGVAKATQQRLTEKSLFTQLGVLIGTPEYMSPEQAELTALDVDTRTDVYSLGVLLYELLVGALPFDPGELRRAGFDELRRKIREEEPSRPSMRLDTLGEVSVEVARQRHTEPGALMRELRGDLDWITMKALEKDRTRRYGSPSDLAADIGRHLAHEPVTAGPPGAAYRLGKFVRRHKIGVVAAAAIVLALAVGAAAATVGMVRAIRAEDVARTEAERATREAETARQVSKFLVGLFEGADPRQTRGDEITVREVLDDGAVKIELELADQPEIRIRLMNTMGRVYRRLGLYDAAETLLLRSLDEARESLGDEHSETLSSMHELADTYRLQTRSDEAEHLLQPNFEARRRVLGRSHPQTLLSMQALADVYRVLGRFQESEKLFLELMEIRRQVYGDDHEVTVSTLKELSRLYVVAGRYAEAEDVARESVEILRRVLGHDHPDTLIAERSLLTAYKYQGRLTEAVDLAEKNLLLRRRVLGDDHFRTLSMMNVLGDIYRMQGQNEAAERMLSEVVERSRGVLGEAHLLTRNALLNLSVVYRNQERYSAAESVLEEALRLFRREDGEEHSNTLLTMFNMAKLQKAQRRYAEAEALFVETLRGQQRVLGENHPRTLSTMFMLAGVHAARGEREQALSLFRDVIERGYEFWGNPEQMIEDSELSTLRGDPEFDALVARVLAATEG
jgi:non-specific serine/threonine protein kinase/serine/threonine-protein kinase